MVKEDGLPLGLGFGLAMNEDAMRGFSSLDDDEKNRSLMQPEALVPRKKCNSL